MTLALVAIDGRTFAIRADRIEKTVAITGASRMSQQRSDIVAAVVDDEVRFFSDLAVRMGGEPAVGSAGAGIVLQGAGSIAGLAVPDAPQEIGFEDHRILPVAGSVGHDVFDACAFFADQSIPVFSDTFLSRLSDGAGVEESAASRVLVHADSSGPASHVTRIGVAGRSYLIATRGPLAPVDPRPAVVGLPGTPGSIAGIAAHEGEMVPVIDLARRLGNDSTASGSIAAACTAGGATIVLLVDEIPGEVPDAAEPIELSPLLAGPSFREAIVVDGEPLPLIRVEGLLAGVDAAEQWADEDPSTPSGILHSDLRVVELALAGNVYAVPEAETVDPPSDLRRTSFPVHHPLVSGAYATGDRVLPEIDLASYLGHAGTTGTAREPILVRSGGVEAVFTATSVEGGRVVSRDDQRTLPIRPAHDVVYGCYVDGDDVRLILNPSAIARYGRDPAVQTALAGLAGPAEEAHDERASGGGTATVVTDPTTGGAPEVSAPASEAPSEVDRQPESAAEQPAQQGAATEGVADDATVTDGPTRAGEDGPPPADRPGADDTPSTPSGDASPADDTPPRGGPADVAPPADAPRRADAPPPANEDEPPAATAVDERSDDTRPRPATPPEPAPPPQASPETTPEPAPPAEPPTADAIPPTPTDEPPTRRRRGRGVLAALLLIVAAGAFAAFVYPGADRIASLLPLGGEAEGRETSAEPEPAEGGSVAGDGAGAEPGTSRDGRPSPAADASPAAGSDTAATEAPGGAGDGSQAADGGPARDQPGPAAGEGSAPEATAPTEPPAEPLAWDEVVYFAPDSALLLPRARRTLDSFARTLADDEAWTLEVIGHTARVGQPETSQTLSERRARVAADYLLERLDPAPRSVVVRGMGARDPAASNATAEGRELNRRVEVFARERQ